MAALDFSHADPRQPLRRFGQETSLLVRNLSNHLSRRIRQGERTISADLDTPAGKIGVFDRLPFDKGFRRVFVEPL